MGEYKTPGVYIKEKNAFGNSVVEAETAIPVFIGLTEKAEDGSKSLLNQPVRITSMTEYYNYFGGAKTHKFNVSVVAAAEADALSVNCGSNKLQAKLEGNLCTLFYHLTLFFANGGSTCYIVSVGDYEKSFATAYTDSKAEVFTAIKKVQDITLLVVPEATDDKSCLTVYTDLLGLCESKKYFAILDIPTKYKEGVEGDADVEKFRSAIGTTNLQFAAAYYPWLETSVLSDNDIDGAVMYLNKAEGDTYSGNATLDKYVVTILAEINNAQTDKDGKKQLKNDLHNALLQNWPAYKLLADKVKASLNHLSPSAAMAGIYAMVDRTRGVWKAPANVSVNYVNKPAEVITDYEQENLNMPMNGKAINAIRTFPGEGIKVWGARTLDGNSNDWRYINVRRTMTFLEQSVKNAARAYVFEPNDASTWINMKCMIENFLRGVWKRGGLAGSSPEDAYEVHIGLGDTMTAEDILEGIMRITVLVAISRPAEFIEITFQQQMQKS
ncbi:MAG: phage tail sheath C-terminal domain-containing protein [Tannerellaceae bacterium]